MTTTAEIGAADTEEETHRAMATARWPDGVRCPRCQCDEVSPRRGRRRRGWRCRSCRGDFTATSGTALHASKAPLSAWTAAAVDGAAHAAVGDKTRRHMRRVVESTGLAPGVRRLAAILTTPSGPAEAGPLEGLSAGQRKILAMLRTRAAGATATLVASETGLSASHVGRCLRALQAEGFVDTESVSVMWGYRPQRLKIWRLDMNERTIAALPQMGWSPPPPETCPATVPGEFWWLFWSGACASQLRIPDDAVHIADTLVGGPDPAARAWALETLPLWALHELRTMSGYDVGEASRWLDFTIAQRRHDSSV